MLTVSEISRRLAERSEDVCQLLLPGGKMANGDWHAGDVSGSEGKSLHVTLAGDHAGEWRDFANPDDHGDLIDLWRSARGLTAAEAIKQAKEWLGISDPHVSQRSEKRYAEPSENGTKPPDPKGKAIEWLTNHRKIDPSTINRFRIEVDPKQRAVVFPCYSPSGKLVNRSYRTLSEPKKVWIDTGCAPCLFGWHGLDERALRDKTVLICEGQIDCMTWTQWGFPSLSVPNGSGTTWIDYSWDDLEAFDTIYLVFDNDPAGSAHQEKAINRLGRHRCLVVGLPTKDANAALLQGATAQEAAIWVRDAKAPSVKGLITAECLENRILHDLSSRPTEVWTLPFFKGDDDASGFYPQPGDTTVWSGYRSDGKSTFLNYWMMSLLNRGETIFIASMELKPERLTRRLITTGVKQYPTHQDVSTFVKEYGPNLIFCDKVGYIAQNELLEMMHFAYQRYGATHFVIDSLMRISKLSGEYAAQSEFMTKLCGFSKSSGAFVHLVAHSRKPPPGASGCDMSVKGDSDIENSADNVVYVVRNRLKRDHEDYDTEVKVTKQRELGWEGSFFLHFDPRHFAYAAIL